MRNQHEALVRLCCKACCPRAGRGNSERVQGIQFEKVSKESNLDTKGSPTQRQGEVSSILSLPLQQRDVVNSGFVEDSPSTRA